MKSPNEGNKSKALESKDPETTRRDFLKVAMTLSAILAFGGIGTVLKSISNPAPPGATSLTFPRIKVADATIAINSPVYFPYPLDSEPNFLVRTGQKAVGGIGPNQDIVAFSQICQHLGCPSISYSPTGGPTGGPTANCSCHGSVFDMLRSANVLSGPSPRQLPQVQLDIDSAGNIFAKGMGPPTIFGHNTGSNDVTADLQGGNVVG